jgi:hypothetical protein
VAEILEYAPERVDAVLAEARADVAWRDTLRLPQPSAPLTRAIDAMDRTVRTATSAEGATSFDALLAVAADDPSDDDGLERLVRRVLLSMLEQRRTRQPTPAHGRR